MFKQKLNDFKEDNNDKTKKNQFFKVERSLHYSVYKSIKVHILKKLITRCSTLF